jgi:hypothetical protein
LINNILNFWIGLILEDNIVIADKVSNDETIYLTLKLLGGKINYKIRN